MNDKKQPPIRRRIFRSLILMFLLLLFVGFGVSYALGWISFHQGNGIFTIEIRTHKATQDTDQAVKRTKDATVETGKVLQRAGEKLEALGDDDAPASESQPTDEPSAEPNDKSTRPEENESAREPRTQPENESPDDGRNEPSD